MPHEIGDRFKDECGVFGVFIKEPENENDAARTAFYGLYALQHRGQESAGIAVSDGHKISLHKGMGLVTEVIKPDTIKKLKGNIADKLGPDSVQGGCFRSQDIVALVISQTERTDPHLIPYADQFVFGNNNQGKGSFKINQTLVKPILQSILGITG
jgi:hypothetical protein